MIEAGIAPDFCAWPDTNDEFISDAGMKPLGCVGDACPRVLLLLNCMDDARSSAVEYIEGRDVSTILDWEDTRIVELRNAESESAEELPEVLVGVVDDHDLYCEVVVFALVSMYPLTAGLYILELLFTWADGGLTKEIYNAVIFAVPEVG